MEHWTLHELKLNICFADAVNELEKPFEIRKNDRGYQKGDLIRYTTVDDKGLHVEHEVEQKIFEITYVLSGSIWGIEEGYVVFGQKRWEED